MFEQRERGCTATAGTLNRVKLGSLMIANCVREPHHAWRSITDPLPDLRVGEEYVRVRLTLKAHHPLSSTSTFAHHFLVGGCYVLPTGGAGKLVVNGLMNLTLNIVGPMRQKSEDRNCWRIALLSS